MSSSHDQIPSVFRPSSMRRRSRAWFGLQRPALDARCAHSASRRQRRSRGVEVVAIEPSARIRPLPHPGHLVRRSGPVAHELESPIGVSSASSTSNSPGLAGRLLRSVARLGDGCRWLRLGTARRKAGQGAPKVALTCSNRAGVQSGAFLQPFLRPCGRSSGVPSR